MQIIKNTSELKKYISIIEKDNSTGFVPTMGAIHQGHISLIEKCVQNNVHSICSLFVNPTQFNDESDYNKYPQRIEQDIKIIKKTNCKVVFIPTLKEMYPQKITSKKYNFGNLDNCLEGNYRPGHFNGVATIIEKLFHLIKPNNVFFGEKDFQQCCVIKKIINDKFNNINIIICKTVRDEKGLALSSRNSLLSKKEKEAAYLIYQNLIDVKKKYLNFSVQEIKNIICEKLNSNELIKVDYVDIRKKNNFEVVKNIDTESEKIILVAAKVGKIRLIDNITLLK